MTDPTSTVTPTFGQLVQPSETRAARRDRVIAERSRGTGRHTRRAPKPCGCPKTCWHDPIAAALPTPGQ